MRHRGTEFHPFSQSVKQSVIHVFVCTTIIGWFNSLSTSLCGQTGCNFVLCSNIIVIFLSKFRFVNKIVYWRDITKGIYNGHFVKNKVCSRLCPKLNPISPAARLCEPSHVWRVSDTSSTVPRFCFLNPIN